MAVGKAAFRVLIKRADAAGKEAAAKVKLAEYVVGTPNDLMGSMTGRGGGGFRADRPVYRMSGSCGFAWINVRPGNSKFANWLKKNQGWRRDSYEGGVAKSVSDYGQVMELKEAYAQAFAATLREAGVKAYAASRLD
jgi:hypothetical protein